VSRSIAWLTEQVVVAACAAARALHPLAPGEGGSRSCRRGVRPGARWRPSRTWTSWCSCPGELGASQKALVEGLLYLLWDLKLKVGHATRSIKEALALARGDMTIRTSLLEMRHLTGDETLTADPARAVLARPRAGDRAEFLEAKLAERDARHMKQGERYVVEPNVKEGKGGLGTSIRCSGSANYVHGVETRDELVARGVFTEEEFATFRAPRTFLGRCAATCIS
jgi:[protein-PII] uridylyltransferase